MHTVNTITSLARRLITIVLLSSPLTAFSQTTHHRAILISAGQTPGSNYSRFYEGTKDIYQSLRASGFKRDEISTLYADGTGDENTSTLEKKTRFYGLSTVEDYFIHSVKTSFEGDAKSDIKFPATQEGIQSAFGDLQNLKSGDSIFIFLNGHAASNLGLVLWKGQYYSVADFQALLSKIPKEVKVKIAVNTSYGGNFLKLTRPGVCVVTNSDSKSPIYHHEQDDPFAKGMATALRGKKGSLSSLLENGAKSDLPQNQFHLSSLDYFLDQHKPVQTDGKETCQSNVGPLGNLLQDIKSMQNCLVHSLSIQKKKYKDRLKKQLDAFATEMQSEPFISRIAKRSKLSLDLKQIQQNWQKLPLIEKEKDRPTLTKTAELIRQEDQKQQKEVNLILKNHQKLVREIQFLENSTPDQFAEYVSIKECLEDEI